MEPRDVGFVYSYWTKFYSLKAKIQTSIIRSTIDHIRKSGGRILIACHAEDPKFCFGFIAWTPGKMLHFVYVLKPNRRWGIGRQLFEATDLGALDEIPCTHWTPDATRIAKTHKQFKR